MTPIVFPDGSHFGWNKDFYGPLEIPGKGWTIKLTEENVMKYAFTIEKYEGHENIRIEANEIFIDGQKN